MPLLPSYNESRLGLELEVEKETFTPEELVAMVLQHAVDISVAYAAEQGKPLQEPPKDVALTTPSFATQTQRLALMDAAQLAGLNVLGMMDETVASALHYAMDKTFEKPQTILFYNMGASSLQVVICKFFTDELPQKYGKPKSVPAVKVLAKAWDETLGGNAFDHVLLELLLDEFNAAWRKQSGNDSNDVRSVPRAVTKLALQANKIKHVLSANTEIPVHMDAVHDNVSLQTHVTREKLEQLAGKLWSLAVAPVTAALQQANLTADDVEVELLGGGMRVPRIQDEISKALGGKELGKHINSDESMALGASFMGANVSTAFRVRHVGLTDITPVGWGVALSDSSDETWKKQVTIFKEWSPYGVKKTIAFTKSTSVDCKLSAGDDVIEEYKITGVEEFAKEMEKLGQPKISLQFELSTSGIATLVKAHAAVEETYTVEEEVEVDDDDESKDGEDKKEEDAKEDKKEEDEKKEEKEDEKKDDKDDEKKKEDDKKDKKKKKTVKVEKVRQLVFLSGLDYFALLR